MFAHRRSFLSTLVSVALIFSALAPVVFCAEQSRRSIAPRIVGGQEVDESEFPTVGRVSDSASNPNGDFCTGTLIAPRFVLCAAHCVADGRGIKNVEDTGLYFKLGGIAYQTARITIHPSYRGDLVTDGEGSVDLSILELQQDVPNVAPTPLYRGEPQVGMQVVLAGFGLVGTGEKGVDDNSPMPPYGKIQFGHTILEKITPTFIAWVFENRPAPDNEANTAPGDSGGPAFYELSGTRYLVGVTSFGMQANAGFGDESYDTRVDIALAWIDSLAGTSDGSNSSIRFTLAPVATPSPARVNKPVQISSAVNVANASFRWSFDDGSQDDTTSGKDVAHMYTVAGTYNVRVTAIDPATNNSVSAICVLPVGDYVDDSTVIPAALYSATFALNFRKENQDRLSLAFESSEFATGAKPDELTGTTVSVFAGYQKIDTMILKKASGKALGRLTWSTRQGTIKYTLSRASLQDAIGPFGAVNDDLEQVLSIPFYVQINETTYGGQELFDYRAHYDRSGSGKLLK